MEMWSVGASPAGVVPAELRTKEELIGVSLSNVGWVLIHLLWWGGGGGGTKGVCWTLTPLVPDYICRTNYSSVRSSALWIRWGR